MTVEILLAGVAGAAVLGAYFADKKHRAAKAKAKAAQNVAPPRWAGAGPVHTPLSSARPAARSLPMSMAVEKRQESAPAASASHDDDFLTRALVTAIVIDSMTPDAPAPSSSYDSCSPSSYDSGSSSYDSGSSSYDSCSSSSSDSGGGF
jgi:hypothetical protein